MEYVSRFEKVPVLFNLFIFIFYFPRRANLQVKHKKQTMTCKLNKRENFHIISRLLCCLWQPKTREKTS